MNLNMEVLKYNPKRIKHNKNTISKMSVTQLKKLARHNIEETKKPCWEKRNFIRDQEVYAARHELRLRGYKIIGERIEKED